jgi:hypothetical protein
MVARNGHTVFNVALIALRDETSANPQVGSCES